MGHIVHFPAGCVTGRRERRSGWLAAFDYLRSFAVLLVVLHHVALAYVTFGYLNPEDPTATISPIVDSAKWAGFDVIVLLDDTFFMPLLFFVSVLFVWRGLQRKGAAGFLRRRLIRLGIPFLIGIIVLNPLAYYPTVLEIELVYGAGQSFGEFWIGLAQRGFATSGPLWFLWLLLVFVGLLIGQGYLLTQEFDSTFLDIMRSKDPQYRG